MPDSAALFATEPELRSVGHDLHRPECVLACASGRLFMSDARGGVMTIGPDGAQRMIGTSGLLPNGIALCRDRSLLVANLGPDGGVWRIGAEGEVSPFLQEVDGHTTFRPNFVALDMQERVWICVSAQVMGDAYPIHAQTGFVVLVDKGGARIVADGLQYTNECRIDAASRYLYVNETFGRRLTRFTLGADGSLRDRETIAQFSGCDFPDGMALDAEGGVWVVCVGSNRIYRVGPDGKVETILDDADPATARQLEAAFASNTLQRPALSGAAGRRLRNASSLAFGGPDLRTAYLGCLNGTSLASFRSPVAGLPLVHWNWS